MLRRALRIVLLVVSALTVWLVLPASAVPPVGTNATLPIAAGRALSAPHPVLTFAGQMHNPAPVPMASNPDPTVCAIDCQLWSLAVATKSPFLVSVHNGTDSIDDGFNLYVYDPAGNQVASSAGIGSNGQAAVVQPTGPGAYTVAVTMTYAYDTDASYLGEARLMTPGNWDQVHCSTPKPCPLLPALQALPPTDVHVDGVPPVASTPLGFPFPVDGSTGSSCYADETAGTGATRCLRFTSEVDNVGSGRLQLQIPWAAAGGGSPETGFVPGLCSAQQVITYSDGSTRSRDAGLCEFHPAHGHFHYRDFVEFSLHKVNPDGTTGTTVAASLKESFCLADDGYFGFGTAGPNGPRGYVGQPDCNVPSQVSPAGPDVLVTMGLTPGWGDIYTWDTPDQFIDITSTPDGDYDLMARANPAGVLQLAGPAKSCATTRIHLTSAAATVVAKSIPCT
jgi:hypothetical protein